MGYQNETPKLLLAMPLPPPYSGPETYTQMLLASPLGERLEIVHLDTSSNNNNADRGRVNWRSSIKAFKKVFLLLWLLWRDHPDLTIVFMPMNRLGFMKFAAVALPCAWSGVPVISSSQGSHFNQFYDNQPSWMKTLVRYTLRQLDAVIVLADCLTRSFESFLPSEKIWTAGLGLDATMFDTVPKKRRTEGVNVLYAGHISKAKGALDLLETIPLVLSRYPDTRFRFAGDILKKERNITFIDNPEDIEAAVYELINREDVRKAVEFLGIVTGEAKLKAFAESDIFVLPSYAEGFPWVVLEAMLASKAVIATPVGALPEVFEHERHLLFVEPGDVKDISQAISRLIENAELRRSLGQAAREAAQCQFNLQSFADQIETVCKNVLERK